MKWDKTAIQTILDLREAGLSNSEIATYLGVGIPSINYALARHKLDNGIPFRKLKFFSEEEKAFIAKEYAAYTPVEVIAQALGRSCGDIRQRILRDRLLRDRSIFCLVKAYGKGVLRHGKTAEEIRNNLQRELEANNKEAREIRKKEMTAKLAFIEDSILNGEMTRAAAFQWGRQNGVTLQEIGDHFKITRERVRQISDNIKPGLNKFGKPIAARALYPFTCTECGRKGFTRSLKRRYCAECLPKVKSKMAAEWGRNHPEKVAQYWAKFYQKKRRM